MKRVCFFWFGKLQRSNLAQRCKCSKTAKNQWLQLLPHCTPPTPTGLNQIEKRSTAHAMHKDTGFLPSIPNQKVKSCCLDSQPQVQAHSSSLQMNQYVSESLVSHRTTAADKYSWRLLHTYLQMYWCQSTVQQHCWYYFYMHATAGTHLARLSRRCNSCILSIVQNIFCFFRLVEAVPSELWKVLNDHSSKTQMTQFGEAEGIRKVWLCTMACSRISCNPANIRSTRQMRFSTEKTKKKCSCPESIAVHVKVVIPKVIRIQSSGQQSAGQADWKRKSSREKVKHALQNTLMSIESHSIRKPEEPQSLSTFDHRTAKVWLLAAGWCLHSRETAVSPLGNVWSNILK